MGEPGEIIVVISVVFLKLLYPGSFDPSMNFSGHDPSGLLAQKGRFLAVLNWNPLPTSKPWSVALEAMDVIRLVFSCRPIIPRMDPGSNLNFH